MVYLFLLNHSNDAGAAAAGAAEKSRHPDAGLYYYWTSYQCLKHRAILVLCKLMIAIKMCDDSGILNPKKVTGIPANRDS